MYAELGISLENIVYYKDETHYFVMSTKKHSLLDKKVLKKVNLFQLFQHNVKFNMVFLFEM